MQSNIDKSLKIIPEDDIALFLKGKAYYHLDRFDEALDCFNNSIKINSENADSWYCKGNIFIERDDPKSAILIFLIKP